MRRPQGKPEARWRGGGGGRRAIEQTRIIAYGREFGRGRHATQNGRTHSHVRRHEKTVWNFTYFSIECEQQFCCCCCCFFIVKNMWLNSFHSFQLARKMSGQNMISGFWKRRIWLKFYICLLHVILFLSLLVGLNWYFDSDNFGRDVEIEQDWQFHVTAYFLLCCCYLFNS